MAPASKANYKTYEAQARMVRAIVAAHHDVKWNYKEIAACYGSDMTEHALNHRFRDLRAQALVIREGRQLGFDMKNLNTELPKTQDKVDKKNIARYFGQSTADGIQFQFRGIKKDADLLRQVERDGGNVATCLSLNGGSNSTMATPSKPTPSRSITTGGSRSATARKRTRPVAAMPEIKQTSSDDEEDDAIQDWSERDNAAAANANEDDDDDDEKTPSKRPKTERVFPRQRTPSRRPAAKATVTIAEAAAAAQFDTSGDSQPEDVDNTPTAAEPSVPSAFPSAFPVSAPPSSIFGPVDRKPTIHQPAQPMFLNRPDPSNLYLTSSRLPEVDFYLANNGVSAYEGDVGDGEI